MDTSNTATDNVTEPYATAASRVLTPEQMDSRLSLLLAHTNPHEPEYREKLRLALDTLRARALCVDEVERQSLTTLLHAQLVHLGVMSVPMPLPPPG